MAIINNNVQNVSFLRNQAPYSTYEEAKSALQSNKGLANDGTALLARYKGDGDDEVKTLVGYVFVSGSTHDITIFDLQDIGDQIDELRNEIISLLGNDITTANTVSEQLAQLSGSTAATSAETSIAGAKAYTDNKIDEEIGKLDYTGVTTGTGVYVTNVTELDGVVSATTTTLPTVNDTAVDLKFVTEVDETLGEISVSRGEITSSNKTISLSANTDGGVDFKANVDGTTIIIDEQTGTMSVASSALVQYEGDDDTIQISAVSQGVRTVSSPLTIEKVTTGLSADVKEEYHLVGASGTTIGAPIQIYKDSSLLSVALLHAELAPADPEVLPTYDKATDTWTDIPATAQTEANQALCYAYEDVSGNTIVAAVPVGSFINEQEFASGITWDTTANKVRGVVDGTSEGFLTVGAGGFKLSGVQDAIDNAVDTAVSDLDATVSAETAHVTVKVDEVDGKLTAVTLTEDNIANADDLATLSGKTVTAITSTNGSITASIDDAVGNKTYDIETDASKIKMSGITSEFTGITEDSSVTDAVEVLEGVIIANEEATEEALEEINDRIDDLTAGSISGITINGEDVAIANNVAGFTVSGATTATTAITSNAIVVQTDNTGNITLGLNYIDCGFYE